MKKKIYFHIKRYQSPWGPFITDKSKCDELLRKAVELGLCKSESERLPTDLEAPSDHRGWPVLFAELQKLGWTPYHGYVPPKLKATHFRVRTIVTYETDEIETAPFVRLFDNWGEWCICGFARRDGKRWVGFTSGVGEDTGQGWEQTHGYVDGWHNYFVHPKVRAHFEKVGLRLQYHPLEWDKPALAEGEFWEIDTPHTMPSCFNHIAQDEDGMRFYEDEGREPAELEFRREEVAAMGDFDAAWTREEIGKPCDPRDGGRLLVVSQRFRRACLDYGLEHVSFVPVKLVG